jgi:hypothetical protein
VNAAAQLERIDRLGLEANLEDCMDFLGALALPHVGARMEILFLLFVQVTTRERGLLENEVARLIRAGAWPRLVRRGPGGTWWPNVSLARRELCEAVKQALEEKRREVEDACM